MPQDNNFQIAVIGGGAAGLAAAISAAQKIQEVGGKPQVAIFEAADRIGKPILVTGNGRCNFSNSKLDLSQYLNAAFVQEATCSLIGSETEPVSEIPADAAIDPVLDFFHNYGLLWREEAEGRLYPMANKASSVVDVLRNACKACEVELRCSWTVSAIEQDERGRFHLRAADGRVAHANAIILACGGRWLEGQALMNSEDGFFGLPLIPQEPVLGPLKTDTQPIRGLDNIRVKCIATLMRDGDTVRAGDHAEGPACRENGEVLFRTYGISGIAAFNLSRYAQPGDVVSLDFVPDLDEDLLESKLHTRRKRLLKLFGNPSAADFLSGMLLPQVAAAVLKAAGISADKPLAKNDVSALVAQLKSFQLTVLGIGDEKQCQVRRGGLDVSAFNPHTLEASCISGLFACGEALDVDGPCGGYNLNWAWTSGLLAGREAAQFLF